MEPLLSMSRCGKHPSRGWKISRICAIFPSPIFSLWKESLYTRLREKSGSEGGGEGLHAVFRHRDDVNCGERFGRKWFMPRYPRGRGGANRLTSDTHENKSWRFEFFKKRWSSVRWSTLSPREFNRNRSLCRRWNIVPLKWTFQPSSFVPPLRVLYIRCRWNRDLGVTPFHGNLFMDTTRILVFTARRGEIPVLEFRFAFICIRLFLL